MLKRMAPVVLAAVLLVGLVLPSVNAAVGPGDSPPRTTVSVPSTIMSAANDSDEGRLRWSLNRLREQIAQARSEIHTAGQILLVGWADQSPDDVAQVVSLLGQSEHDLVQAEDLLVDADPTTELESLVIDARTKVDSAEGALLVAGMWSGKVRALLELADRNIAAVLDSLQQMGLGGGPAPFRAAAVLHSAVVRLSRTRLSKARLLAAWDNRMCHPGDRRDLRFSTKTLFFD